jgi:hypothetical protein
MQRIFIGPTGTVNNSNRLNCTANDVRIARAISATCSGPNCFDAETCIRDRTFDLTATFEVIVTANARYDTAFFFRIDGGANARGDGTTASGTCSLSKLTPTVSPAQNLDGDTCGDLNAGTFNNITFTIPGVECSDPDEDGFVNLPNCTSWHSNQGTACTAADEFTANPDTKSKCVCDDTFQIPIHVAEPATITVDKSVTPESVLASTGGDVTYTVKVENTSTEAEVNITSLTDDQYGNLNGQGNCATPFTLGISDGTAGSGPDFFTCSFTITIAPGAEGSTVVDVVTASGLDENDNPVTGFDDATVTRSNVTPTARAEKAATAFCTDVTFQVKVFNTSAVDDLTLNTLTDDKFGDITSVHDAAPPIEQVVSTTCATGGTIPLSDPTNNPYTCTFVGRICGTSNTNHTNNVEGGLTDNENTAITTDPDGSATVTVTIQ